MTGFAFFFVVMGLVLLAAVALAALAFIGAHLLFRLFGKTSGLDQLAEMYPASQLPPGHVTKRQWVGVGGVGFTNNADVCATPEGLYLWVRPFLGRYKPALIPWDELRDPQPTILYLQSAIRLTVGDPQVTRIVFTRQFFETIRPYLS